MCGGGLPVLLGRRLLFGAGVLLGALWRLALLLAVLFLVHGICTAVAPDRLNRIDAIWHAGGPPLDAQRLGVGWADHVAAWVGLALVAAFALLWLADTISRVVCARVAVYLLTRRDQDGVAVDHLRASPQIRAATTAEAAGFVEVDRLGGTS